MGRKIGKVQVQLRSVFQERTYVMKRTLTVLLAVFLLLFVGCSTTKNNKTAEPAAPNEEAVKEEAAKEEVNEEVANEETASEEAASEEVTSEETVREEAAEEEPQEYDNVGIRMDLSEVAANAKGALLPYPIGLFDDDRNIYVMPIYYIAMPKEEASAILYDMDAPDEDIKKLDERKTVLHVIVASAIDYDQTLKILSEKLQIDYSEQMARAEVIGTADGYTFYAIPERDEQKLSAFDEEYLAEYDKLQQELFDIEKSATLFAPVDPAKEMVGQKLEFTTTDLDGNTVTSKELFAANEITVVNCWGLWCGNCMEEMAELKEFHDKIQEKGCGVVGLEYEDEWNDEVVKYSKDTLNGFGITYPNVMIPEELLEQLLGFPTTFFVDKEGTVLCMPITGAYVDKYESALESLLQGEAAADIPVNDAANAIAENLDVLYNVYVTDENGPVAGVTIQFCSSTSCKMGKTDAEGLVSFSMPAGEIYDIHVLRLPEGYEKDDTVYHTEDEKSDVQIQLKKK